MTIEIYSKSELGFIQHFGYLQYDECIIIRNEAEKLQLACLKFLPYGGDIIFNPEQSQYIVNNEVPLLKKSITYASNLIEALDLIQTAALAVSSTTHTFLIFEGD